MLLKDCCCPTRGRAQCWWISGAWGDLGELEVEVEGDSADNFLGSMEVTQNRDDVGDAWVNDRITSLYVY